MVVCIGFMLCIIVPHQLVWPHMPCDTPHSIYEYEYEQYDGKQAAASVMQPNYAQVLS